MNSLIPVIAGAVSTAIFAASALPMLMKAFRTKDLKSYSLPNIALSNVGNVIHSVYVYSLPPGPIWVLHGFYVITTGLMLLWYLRYELWDSRGIAEAAANEFAGGWNEPKVEVSRQAYVRMPEHAEVVDRAALHGLIARIRDLGAVAGRPSR